MGDAGQGAAPEAGRTVSILIPACNESGQIGACLAYLLASDPPRLGGAPAGVEVIVMANGCTDTTADEARATAPDLAARGWRLVVLDLPEGGKTRALNAGDRAASGAIRIYLDADVHVSPGLVAGLAAALDRPEAAHAGGEPRVRPGASRVTRAYGRFWMRLPFITEGVPGNAVFAVNAAGRARWGAFPDVVADDSFVRLHFAPHERHRVAASYDFPLAEGFRRLVPVRRRQDRGHADLLARFPALRRHAGGTHPGPGRLARLALADPAGFATYAAVAVAVRLPVLRDRSAWARGH
jgi:glycosyltransferase involved in cell wall biosynthesis